MISLMYMSTVNGPGDSHSTGIRLLTNTMGNLICMHAQLRVWHWIAWFPFEMFAITVSGDYT